jgi:2-C-methyl-D-erythritol 4-phosphate cytidylyltransferase
MHARKHNVAIILAGGKGTRFGLDVPKQFAKLAGKTVVEHTLDVFQQHDLIDEICIVTHKDWSWRMEEIVESGNYSKVEKIIIGGSERKDSSLSAIEAYKEEAREREINFLFHDAVRPFVDNRIIDQCIEALNNYGAIDVAIPATDTIIQVLDHKISFIPTRKEMMQGQTPQCFKYEIIAKAYENALKDTDLVVSDDCGVVKKYLPKQEIFVVRGSLANIKITHPQDIFLADKIIQMKTHKILSRYSDDYYHDSLKDKVIVIFGGSKGIGASMKEISERYGAKVYSFSRGETNTDVSSISDIKRDLAYVYQKENRIDYVVNTAGILIKKPLINTTFNDIMEIVNINYIGAVNILKEAIPYLETNGGQILNFTSSSYTRGRSHYSLYSSTKAAIVNLTQALGEELAAKNIKVNCINPERTLTPMRTSNFGKEDPNTLLSAEQVAYVSINTLLSNMTGQIVDVKLQQLDIND